MHIVTDEPDGSVVRDECVIGTQIAIAFLLPLRLNAKKMTSKSLRNAMATDAPTHAMAMATCFGIGK